MIDNCPECGRRITDWDMTGCEAPDGQRWCLIHVPAEPTQEMIDAFLAHWRWWRSTLPGE